MSRTLAGVAAGLLAGIAATWALSQSHHEKAAGEEPQSQSRPLPADGQGAVHLDAEEQQHAGIQIQELSAVQQQPEIEAYGRVLDPTPLAELVAERIAARAAEAASTRELERVRLLHDCQQNVSSQALETAEAAAMRDQSTADAVDSRLLTSWGAALANRADLTAFVRSLTAQKQALVRVDVPLTEVLHDPPTSARFARPGHEDDAPTARYIGPAPQVDPQMQGQGFIFLLDSHPLPPGTALTAWLTTAGAEQQGLLVPRSALLRHDGELFVYVQSGAELFRRTRVELGRPLPAGWLVQSGLEMPAKVVVAGAQQLLSEELLGRGEAEE